MLESKHLSKNLVLSKYLDMTEYLYRGKEYPDEKAMKKAQYNRKTYLKCNNVALFAIEFPNDYKAMQMETPAKPKKKKAEKKSEEVKDDHSEEARTISEFLGGRGVGDLTLEEILTMSGITDGMRKKILELSEKYKKERQVGDLQKAYIHDIKVIEDWIDKDASRTNDWKEYLIANSEALLTEIWED